MPRRFLAWAILAAAMLGGSTVFGWLLNAAIGPRKPDYNRMWGGMVARPPVPTTPNATLNRSFTAFQPSQAVPAFEAQEFQRVLDTIAARLDLREHAAIAAEFDTARMAEEEIPLGIYALFGQVPAPASLLTAGAQIQEDLFTLVEQDPHLLPRGRVGIVRVAWSANRQEALVLAKHLPPAGPRFVRWWMKRDPVGTWKVYDFDLPNSRLRFLAVRNYRMNLSAFDHPGNPAEQVPNTFDLEAFHRYEQSFDLALIAGNATDPAAASVPLWNEPVEAVRAIPYIQAARYAAQARWAAIRGDAPRAEAALRSVPSSMATAALVDLVRATVHNAKKNPHQARISIQAYRQVVGDDPLAYLEDAKAIAALDGPDAAIAELRKGLTVFPGDRSLVMELARRLPAAERPALGALLATAERADLLDTAAFLFERQFPSILDDLTEGVLRARPNDLIAQRMSVRSKLALGQPKEAGERMKRIPADRRPAVVDWHVGRAMASATPMDDYTVLAAVGEGRRTYREWIRANAPVIASPGSSPDRAKRIESLKEFVALHKSKEADDPWLHYGQALIQFAAAELEKADAELAAGMAKLTPPARTARLTLEQLSRSAPEDWEPFRALRVDLLARRGKWKQAYDLVRPSVDTFDQLMNRFAAERDEFAMAELIELHAKSHATDLELIAWRGEVSYLKKDYEAAVKSYRNYRDIAGKENRQYYRMTERLIRSLVRLKRPTEARDILDDANATFPIPQVLQTLVAAASGDADAVLERFDRNTGAFNPAAWYADPDLGPLLRGPAFEAVRQKYPPPVR